MIIQVCVGSSCHLKGSPEIVERVKNIFAGSSKKKEEEALVPTQEATTETATENNAQ